MMMMTSRWTAVLLTAAMLAGGIVLAGEETASDITRLTFDTLKAGTLPAGWIVDATNRRGSLARWKVAADPEAPSPPNVLRAVPRPDSFGGTFNLCRTGSIQFQDGEIEVTLRADSGEEDQGGGPIWRAADGDNYYIARYNPLEHNFRLYTVRRGARRMLAGASGIAIPAGRWFTIRVVQEGDHIRCFLDGEKYIDIHDSTFPGPGGVGLWTKADAATSFDDFTVRPAAR